MGEIKEFDEAFSLTMKFEVGPSFDANDPAIQAGLIDTRENRRKTGYVNHPNDRGGETKFGIAANFDSVNIKTLTLDQAKAIYEKKYWFANQCDKMEYPLNVLHFDACVNHGGKAAVKFLQRALGPTVKTDGVLGPITLAKIKEYDATEISQLALKAREQFYYRLVELKPSQQVFMKGWMNRISGLQSYLNVAKAAK